MCGILGQISKDSHNVNTFRQALLSLTHRGPDDLQIFSDEYIMLGHTRLSIIDLSIGGSQPMISSCGNYILVYNGEIYNFTELRMTLSKKGYTFKSSSDSEVLLNGYIEYGENIASKLNGMFAFAIYEKKNKTIFLARDKSGIKPLYYFHNENCFAFSSELKGLIRFSKELNQKSKVLFLLFGYVPEPETVFKNIFSFPSGSFGVYKDSTLKIKNYTFFDFNTKLTKSYEEITDEVFKTFNGAINRHLVSDAPIGVFLSGGLDSSLITSVASKYKKKLHTVSLNFFEEDYSEGSYQDLIANKFKTHHTNYIIDKKIFFQSIEDFFKIMEQPSIDGLNTYLISKVARESGLKVVLSGLGADELFFGYSSFTNANILKNMSKIPYFFLKIFENSKKYRKLEFLNVDTELAYYLPSRGLFSPTEVSKLLDEDLQSVYDIIYELSELYSTNHIKDIKDKICSFELELYMKSQLLKDSDVFGMANSLEIRVPFLDIDLLNLSLKIRSINKMGKFNKNLLISSLAKDIPSEIYHRKKMGFTLPFEHWFLPNLKTDPGVIKFKNRLNPKFDYGWSRLWALYVMEKFYG